MAATEKPDIHAKHRANPRMYPNFAITMPPPLCTDEIIEATEVCSVRSCFLRVQLRHPLGATGENQWCPRAEWLSRLASRIMPPSGNKTSHYTGQPLAYIRGRSWPKSGTTSPFSLVTHVRPRSALHPLPTNRPIRHAIVATIVQPFRNMGSAPLRKGSELPAVHGFFVALFRTVRTMTPLSMKLNLQLMVHSLAPVLSILYTNFVSCFATRLYPTKLYVPASTVGFSPTVDGTYLFVTFGKSALRTHPPPMIPAQPQLSCVCTPLSSKRVVPKSGAGF